jgi:hypothetical protein
VSKKTTYLTWTLLTLTTITSLWFGISSYYKEPPLIEPTCNVDPVDEPEPKVIIKDALNLGGGTPFRDDMLDKCPADTNVPDQFGCIYYFASTTKEEADNLAKKLISVSPQKAGTGISFEFGSAESLTYMVDFVSKAQKAKDDYVNNICNLDSMKIYGGSGMDLEQNACIYYYNEQYLRILQSLEHRIIF